MEKIKCKICQQNLLDRKDQAQNLSDGKDKMQNFLDRKNKVQNMSAKSFGWKRENAKFVSKIFWIEKIECKICQQNLLDEKDKVQN